MRRPSDIPQGLQKVVHFTSGRTLFRASGTWTECLYSPLLNSLILCHDITQLRAPSMWLGVSEQAHVGATVPGRCSNSLDVLMKKWWTSAAHPMVALPSGSQPVELPEPPAHRRDGPRVQGTERPGRCSFSKRQVSGRRGPGGFTSGKEQCCAGTAIPERQVRPWFRVTLGWQLLPPHQLFY